MAIYICEVCDEPVDGDWSPCTESPNGGLVCEGCWTENSCDSCDEWIGESGHKGSDSCSDCWQAEYDAFQERKFEDMKERERGGSL